MKKSIFMVAAAMLAMLATSCNKEEEVLMQTPITISANYGGGDSKVAYTEDGNNITATWETGDELIVCWNGHKNTLTLSSGAGTASATFTGTITGTPTANSTLVCFVKDKNNPGAVIVSDNGDYLYTDGTFLAQDGTLAGAAKCNLYYGTCFYGDGTNISCTFNVNTSMMKFTLKNLIYDADNNATLEYKSGNTVLACASFAEVDGDNTIYLTIPAGNYSGKQTLVYSCGAMSTTYTLTFSNANFAAGQTYSKDIEFPLMTPITFEAMVANAQVTFYIVSGVGTVQYNKYDGNGWRNYTSATAVTLTNVGDKVSFRGNNDCYRPNPNSSPSTFACSNCYLYGNVMSLVSSTGYAQATSVVQSAFEELFAYNFTLKNHPNKDIALPATTLGNFCYYMMFYESGLTRAPELPATTLSVGCYEAMFARSSLTAAPELPATTMANGCYIGMFSGCTSLTTAPALPATTLDEECYKEMFSNCTGLTTPPALPATTMAHNCYAAMFYGCTGLTTAPALPATALAEGCYISMFENCTNLGVAPALPATSLENECYRSMFTGCTDLISAPVLPATTLVTSCYSRMFKDCTNLNYVKSLATNISAEYCTDRWLEGVASSGTFVKASGTSWTTGISGIPSGWTVQEQ